MNYPYISILPLIDEIRSELSRITKASAFSDEDMYGWAIDAARLIGNAAYDSDSIFLSVTNHVFHLPQSFYLVNNIYICEDAGADYIAKPLPNMMPVRRWVRSRIMRPADTITRKFCTYKCTRDAELSYTIKVPPGIGRVTFRTGTVELEFEKLVMGEDGSVMMQDEPNALKAVKAYVILMLLKEKYILQEIPQYVYRDFQTEWDDYKHNARISLKFPSQADTQFKAIEQDARFRQFRYKDQ